MYEDDWFPEDPQVVKTFLAGGGFMYFDEDGQVVKVTTIGQWRDDCDKVGVHFGEKQMWDNRWTRAMKADARFHKISFQQMQNMGATEVCWLCPDEQINGCIVPKIPYGGFAYLFDDFPWLDCYFPVI